MIMHVLRGVISTSALMKAFAAIRWAMSSVATLVLPVVPSLFQVPSIRTTILFHGTASAASVVKNALYIIGTSYDVRAGLQFRKYRRSAFSEDGPQAVISSAVCVPGRSAWLPGGDGVCSLPG